MTVRRFCLYIIGLFVLSLGVSFSIQATLGVSPVSSLAYAFTLTSGFSIGLMTIAANILFIGVQIILNRRFNLRESFVQLLVAFVFGFFMDFTLYLLRLFPAPETILMQFTFVIISMVIMAFGLFSYFNAKFPLMPYDELTHVISEHFNIEFSKAKITGDLSNVAAAGLISVIFINSLGSIGIGTVLAAYFVGKITGWLMKNYQKYLIQWINKDEDEIRNKDLIEQKLIEEESSDEPHEENTVEEDSPAVSR